MSRLFKFINNQINYLTGWYSERNQDDVTLRLSYNTSEYTGALRFNSKISKPEFQGYNGNKWITFNSTQGEKGDKGTDFDEIINLVNLNLALDSHKNQGYLFPTNKITNNTLFIKSLNSSKYTLNNKQFDSVLFENTNNSVNIMSNPRPYTWDLNSINLKELKSNDNDLQFKAYGNTFQYEVAENFIVTKGQTVTLVNSNNKLCIKPFTFVNDVNLFIDNSFIVGIALQDCLEGNKCLVCTEGITTVRCSNNRSKNYINDYNIKLGNIGLVNNDGFIFKTLIRPKKDYLKLGYFLEDRNETNQNNEKLYYLFYIKN